MKKILIVASILTFYLSLASPGIASAEILNIWDGTGEGGVSCNQPILEGDRLVSANACDFCDGLIIIQNIVKLLTEVAIPIAFAMIIYGALMLMIAVGSEEKVKKSRGIMTSAVVGLVIALSAWIIVNTILHVLTGQPDFPWNQISC